MGGQSPVVPAENLPPLLAAAFPAVAHSETGRVHTFTFPRPTYLYPIADWGIPSADPRVRIRARQRWWRALPRRDKRWLWAQGLDTRR